MPSAPAVSCSLRSCRNRTLSPSGRCHLHDSSAAKDAPLRALPTPAPSAPEDFDYTLVLPVLAGEKVRIQDHIFDGPTKVYTRDGLMHRLGAPALIRELPEGTETEWWQMGERHRDDGPAVVRADGTEEWWYRHEEFFVEGPSPEGVPAHLRAGAHYTFSVEDQEKLVAAEVDIEQAIEVALDEDLTSAEAVLAILGGAPAEWARSYDEGVST